MKVMLIPEGLLIFGLSVETGPFADACLVTPLGIHEQLGFVCFYGSDLEPRCAACGDSQMVNVQRYIRNGFQGWLTWYLCRLAHDGHEGLVVGTRLLHVDDIPSR